MIAFVIVILHCPEVRKEISNLWDLSNSKLEDWLYFSGKVSTEIKPPGYLFNILFSFPLDINPKVGLLDHMVDLFLIF